MDNRLNSIVFGTQAWAPFVEKNYFIEPSVHGWRVNAGERHCFCNTEKGAAMKLEQYRKVDAAARARREKASDRK